MTELKNVLFRIICPNSAAKGKNLTQLLAQAGKSMGKFEKLVNSVIWL
jgi:hypothetical protein